MLQLQSCNDPPSVLSTTTDAFLPDTIVSNWRLKVLLVVTAASSYCILELNDEQ